MFPKKKQVLIQTTIQPKLEKGKKRLSDGILKKKKKHNIETHLKKKTMNLN